MTELSTEWTFRARGRTLVDGDTLDLAVDCGFHVTRRVRVRLAGIDTAETYGVSHDSDEYKRGREHEQFVAKWLARAAVDAESEWPLRIATTQARGKYGRWLADIERVTDGERLSDALLDEYGDEVRSE